MWLRDSLPRDLEGVRVMIYGYNTGTAKSSSFYDLEALASIFRRSLLQVRRGSTVRFFPFSLCLEGWRSQWLTKKSLHVTYRSSLSFTAWADGSLRR